MTTLLQQAEATDRQISEIKRKSPASLLFFGSDSGYWTARGSDAVEVCFCTGMSLNYSRKHIPDEETTVVLPASRIDGVITRLVNCGNPVATINEYTNEVLTYWPAPYEPPVDDTESAPLPPIQAISYEPGVEWMDFEAISKQIINGTTYGQVSLPDFSLDNESSETPF